MHRRHWPGRRRHPYLQCSFGSGSAALRHERRPLPASARQRQTQPTQGGHNEGIKMSEDDPAQLITCTCAAYLGAK